MAVIKETTQVLIVGAGPAGATTSMFLSNSQIPHIIIDKATFPRPKTCGDAISYRALQTLYRACPDWYAELLASTERYLPCTGIDFYVPNGICLPIPYPSLNPHTNEPQVIVAQRHFFDNFLVSKLNSQYATLLLGTTGAHLTRNASGITATMQHGNDTIAITAPLIVGADGDKSIVRKTLLNHAKPEKSSSVGISIYMSGVHPQTNISLYFLKDILPGYFWIFPLSNGHANVGIGNIASVVRQKKINLKQQLADIIYRHPSIAPLFAAATEESKYNGWGLPLAKPKQPLSGDNFLLTGDAGSLIDPFTGEGIGNAMYSGMVAAMAIKTALAQRNYSASLIKTAYDNEFYRRLGSEITLSNTLQHLTHFPRLTNAIARKVLKSPTLKNAFYSVYAGKPIHTLLSNPLFYWKVLVNG